MCIDAPESTKKSHSSAVFKVGAGIALASIGKYSVALPVFFWAYKHFFAKYHAALRAHLSWCQVSSCVLSSNLGAQGLRSWSSHIWIIPRDGPFLSRILTWCHVPLENLTACFHPSFPPFLRIDFFRQESWDTQPNDIDSFDEATDPFAPPFFDFLLAYSSASTCRNGRFIAICASWFKLVIETHGRVPKITWRIRTFSSSNLGTFFWLLSLLRPELFGSIFPSICLRFWCKRGRLSFRPPSIESVSRYGIMAATAWVSFRTLSICLPLPAISTFLSTLALFPFRLRVTTPP